jgi:tripartite-type tricarboxylate transporter receptor subunit TctC
MYNKMVFILAIMLIYSFSTGSALAQKKYPEKPIQAIVAYPPGGSTDAAARLLVEFLKKYLGQPVIAVNKPGGGAAIGANELFKSKPDGYTIGIFNENAPFPELQINPGRYIYKAEDIQGVAQSAGYVPALFTRYDAPWKSLEELIDFAKKNPNVLKWGHPGRGGLMWIIGNLFIQQTGMKVLEVPSSDAEGFAALLGNHIDMFVSIYSSIPIAQVEAKKMRILCLATQKRVDIWPDLPTAEELGYPFGVPDVYLGTFVPKGTPKEAIAILSGAIKKVSEDLEFKEKMKKIGFPAVYRDTKDFEILIENYARIKYNFLKKLGIL